MSTTHRIEPERRTLHGHFSRDLAPVLTIDPGDRVRVRTLDAGWGLTEQPDPFGPALKFEPRDPELDKGHALCGPIAVRGAGPGMALEVRTLALRPGRWGWTNGGGFESPLNHRLGLEEKPGFALRWAIDADAGTATSQRGQVVRLRPFMGVLGMPPAEPGVHSTIPPRASGGNIDCKELVAGSALFLPITVPGALFSVGDGHGVQGDGEVSGLAMECPMEAELEFHLHPGMGLSMPRALTPAGWVTFGFHEDLNEATITALDGMLSLIEEQLGCERREATALASLVVDLHITQLVNGVRGVHAILRDGALIADQPRGR
jgi:acetamidase/formamidase